MSFTDDYNAQKKKRKDKEKEQVAKSSKTNFEKQYYTAAVDRAPVEDIAPVAVSKQILDERMQRRENEATKPFFSDETKKAQEERTVFKSAEGNIAQKILGTAGDALVGVAKGFVGSFEGITDLAAYGVAGIANKAGAEDFAEDVKRVAQRSQTDKIFGGIENTTDKYSWFGDKTDAFTNVLGQVASLLAGGAVGKGAGLGAKGVTAVTTAMTGASSMGSGMSEAYEGGATDGEATAYGAISGVINAGTELLAGGLGKAINAVGISRGIGGLDDIFAKKVAGKVTSKISNEFWKNTISNAAEYGIKSAAEGAEEVLAGYGTALAKKLTYMSDEELKQIVEDENILEQFVMGTLAGGAVSLPGVVSSTAAGSDYVTGYTQSEQAVIEAEVQKRITEAEKNGEKPNKSKIYDAVVSDMEKGYIDTDTIESVLGGEDYTNYQNELKRQEELDNELKELRNMKSGDMTDIQAERMAELKAMKPNTEMVESLKFNVDEKVRGALGQNSRLSESYNERARRGQVYEADLSKYDEKQKAVIQKAIDSGILNNTNRTHEFVDMVAKISADKGVLFDFTNNAKLKESSFAVDGAAVNGYVTADGITVNIDSHKAVNSVVGHEITHVLEGTELYAELKTALFEYAKSKGDYQGRHDTLSKLYANVEGADVDAELTADLVGDYLFTDSDFINNLSTKHRNVFQKVYDEIKYLCKIATAGSRQARELERVKRAFDAAYKESGKGVEGAKYSLSDNEGKTLTKEQSEYFKDSKVRDEGGALKVMYHGSQDAGFHVFDPSMSDDGTSLFFVDRNEVAASYSGTSETYEAKAFKSAEDANKFFASIGKSEYEVIEKDGEYTLYDDGDEVATSGDLSEIYDEWRDWEGVGYGDANYKVYLNLKNPYVVDAKGNAWNDLFDSEVSEYFDFDEEFPLKTRDFAQFASENDYDGVIIKNVRDNGGYSNGDEGASTVAIAFSSEQVKSVANEKPTGDPDIRYSLTKDGETPKKYGNYNVRGEDIRYNPAQDVTPIGETVSPTDTPTDTPTVSETENVAPVAEDVPDIEPREPSLQELQQEYDDLTARAVEMTNAEDFDADAFDAITNEITALESKIKQMESDESARFSSLDDADAPPEVEAPYYTEREAITLDGDHLREATKKVADLMGLDAEDSAAMARVIQTYAQNPNITKEELTNEIQKNFKYSEVIEDSDDNVTQRAKEYIRGTHLYISPDLKADFNGKRADGYNAFRKEHFGHFHLTTDARSNAMGVDEFYAELNEKFPEIFPEDVTNVADQLSLIGEVVSTAQRTYERVGDYDTDTVSQVVDLISSEIGAYGEAEIQRSIEQDRRAFLDDIAPVAEKYEAIRPPKQTAEPRMKRVEGETHDTVRKGQVEGQRTMLAEAAAEAKKEKPIKTVKDRLEHKLHASYGELSHNKRLRREALENFNAKIDALQLEYDNKKNHETKVANDILRRIEQLKRRRDEVDADYTKRINDNRARVEKYKALFEEGYSDEEGRMMRSELHAQKIDEIKTKFSKNGLDLDDALKNAKNLSTFATVDNTPQRVMEKSLGYKAGQILADETVNRVARNESEGIKWLNSVTSRDGKGGLLKQLLKQYHIKPGSKESAAAQIYAEGFYVKDNGDIIKYGDAELAADFPNVQTQRNIKGLAGDARIRQFYDDTLAAINESRTRNAYPEIKPLDNYYLHFRAMEDTFSRMGIPFNPNDIKAKDLPTDLNGVTADLKPGQPYFASAMHRRGNKTTYDLLGGIERYAVSAKNQIYHIDDIQTLRALRNYIADTYGQANGLDNLDALSEEEVQDRIKQVYGAHLSTFAKFLNEEANVIAGKTALIDRGLEGIIGRRGIQFLNTINQQVGSNMVGGNVSSSLTNLLPVVQAYAKTNKTAFVRGFAQTMANKVGRVFGKADSFADNPTAIRRKGADRFARTPWQKTQDFGYALMSAVDNISTEVIVRAKYNEYIKKGMSQQQAITEADKWASRLMGDRSLGQMPQLYNSKMLGLITKFQLEVRNQLDSQFYDTIQEAKVSNEDIENGLKRNAKTAAKVTATFVELAIVQHIFGKVFESIAGYNPAFDIIDVLVKTLGFDDEEESEDTALDNVEQGLLALLEDLPYTSTLTGGRIPISSALPIKELVTGKDDYGNEKSRLETIGEIAPYYVLPTGYGQVKKTAQGLSMFDEELPVAGSYTDSGNLRFPVDDTLGNRVQAGLFGQWANENARDYFDNDIAPLNEKQTEEFAQSGMSIQDYWRYREGLKDFTKQDEKVEYINGLDLNDEQKNVLKSYLFDEKGYAEENPEKYAFLESEGIGYLGYKQLDDDTQSAWSWAFNHQEEYRYLKANGVYPEDYSVYYIPMVEYDDEGDAAYSWAFDNPEKATIGKAFEGGVKSYRKYVGELSNIEADKDSSGKPINGSRKEKVLDYINNLDADYGEKIILLKSEYPATDTYNYDIIEYLNSREDISYDEMVTILKELGFTVHSNGTVTW